MSTGSGFSTVSNNFQEYPNICKTILSNEGNNLGNCVANQSSCTNLRSITPQGNACRTWLNSQPVFYQTKYKNGICGTSAPNNYKSLPECECMQFNNPSAYPQTEQVTNDFKQSLSGPDIGTDVTKYPVQCWYGPCQDPQHYAQPPDQPDTDCGEICGANIVVKNDTNVLFKNVKLKEVCPSGNPQVTVMKNDVVTTGTSGTSGTSGNPQTIITKENPVNKYLVIGIIGVVLLGIIAAIIIIYKTSKESKKSVKGVKK